MNIIPHIYMWYNRNRFTDIENKLVVTSGDREGRMVSSHQGYSIKRYKLLRIEKQQGYILQHGKLQPLSYNNFSQSTKYKNTVSLFWISETNIVNQLYFNLKSCQMFAQSNINVCFMPKQTQISHRSVCCYSC